MSREIKDLKQYTADVLYSDKHILYLIIDKKHKLIEYSGDVLHYGLDDVETAQNMEAQLPFLVGTTDGLTETLVLEFVAMPSAKFAHVHLMAIKNGFALVFIDSTREQNKQRRYQQVANNLALLDHERASLLKELEQANKLKSLFIGRMSHEFRTPLSSILGYSELLLDDKIDPLEARRMSAAVQRGARYLANMVDNLLDQASIEENALQLHPAACDLHELADEMEEIFRPIANKKGLTFAWWFASDLPTRVWVDPLRLRQILINLFSNAVKFTRKGGVSVDVEWHDNNLEVAVSDTGPGISADAAERIFKPFEQAGVMNSHAHGAGLGLTITRALVERMGGEIRLDTDSDEDGARLVFNIEAPARGSKATSKATILKSATIVVADDDVDILSLLKIYLSTLSSRVIVCRDGDELVKAVHTHKPALILIDMQLGSAHGHVFAKKLRSLGVTQPIVLMSAADNINTRETAKSAGCNDFLPKPFTRATLLEHMEALLS